MSSLKERREEDFIEVCTSNEVISGVKLTVINYLLIEQYIDNYRT